MLKSQTPAQVFKCAIGRAARQATADEVTSDQEALESRRPETARLGPTDLDHGAWTMGPGSRDLGQETWAKRPGPRDFRPKDFGQDPRRNRPPAHPRLSVLERARARRRPPPSRAFGVARRSAAATNREPKRQAARSGHSPLPLAHGGGHGRRPCLILFNLNEILLLKYSRESND
jgi:hypothetical protein